MRCNTDPAVQAICSNVNSQVQEKKEVIVGISNTSNTSNLASLPYKLRENACLKKTDKTLFALSVQVKKLAAIPAKEKEDKELLSFTKREAQSLQSMLDKPQKTTQKNEETLLAMTDNTMSVLSGQIKTLEKISFEEDEDEDIEFLRFIQKEQKELQSKLSSLKKSIEE